MVDSGRPWSDASLVRKQMNSQTHRCTARSASVDTDAPGGSARLMTSAIFSTGSNGSSSSPCASATPANDISAAHASSSTTCAIMARVRSVTRYVDKWATPAGPLGTPRDPWRTPRRDHHRRPLPPGTPFPDTHQPQAAHLANPGDGNLRTNAADADVVHVTRPSLRVDRALGSGRRRWCCQWSAGG